MDLTSFTPIFLYVGVLAGFCVVVLVLAALIGPHRYNAVKDMPYESGMDPVGDARQHFDVKFYLMAILFLIFDVELLFLYPWAVAAYSEGGVPFELQNAVFTTMLVFLGTLFLGYLYAWKKGVFEWR
ncbi:MAG: NADH-quinone oxidoreductase subunit A [Planctomycetia bacterium]